MPHPTRKAAPAELRAVRRQFREWRATKQPGDRIPQHLWKDAAQLVPYYGMCRVAESLRLNPAALRRYTERHPGNRRCPPTPTAFVEGSLPAGLLLGTSAAEYTFEIEEAGAATLRIRVRGAGVAEVAALAQALRPSPERTA